VQASAASALASAQSNAQSSASVASAALASAQSALSSAAIAANTAAAGAAAASAAAAAAAAAGVAAGAAVGPASPAQAEPLTASAGPAVTSSQVCATGTLPLAQVLAIGIGAVVVVTLLSFAIYFMVIMMKRRKDARDSYLDEKNFAASPKKLPSRYSSSARTGNAITLKFNPKKSSDSPAPSMPAIPHTESRKSLSFSLERNSIETLVADRGVDFPASALPAWPLTLSFMNKVNVVPKSPVASIHEIRPIRKDIPAAHSPKDVSSQLESKALSSPRYVQPKIPTVPAVAQTSVATKPPRPPQEESRRKVTATPRTLVVAPPPSPPPPPPLPSPLPPALLKVESPETSPFDDPSEDSIEGMALDSLPTEPRESMLVDNLATYPTYDQWRNSTASEPETEIVPKPEMEIVPEPEIAGTPEPELEETTEPMVEWAPPSPPLMAQVFEDEIPVEEIQQDDEVATIAYQAERPSTPVKQAPTFEVDIIDAELPSPAATESPPHGWPQLLAPAKTMSIERSVSPLRRNPFVSDMTPSPIEPQELLPVVPMDEDEDEYEDDLEVEDESETEDEVDDEDEDVTDIREERGRSMIRTSDVIESRLSGIQAAIEEQKLVDVVESHPELERTFSPLRLNPVDRSMAPVPVVPRSRTKSPLAANPKRRSKSLSPPPRSNSLRRVIINNSLSRENSPLRQNPVRAPPVPPVGANTKLSAAAIASRPQARDKFAQILSQFKFMADENPVDSAKASQEVTQRAIAGIAIPISMREQAVRNSGKSRERGKKPS
jgi:hypothetical protein